MINVVMNKFAELAIVSDTLTDGNNLALLVETENNKFYLLLDEDAKNFMDNVVIVGEF